MVAVLVADVGCRARVGSPELPPRLRSMGPPTPNLAIGTAILAAPSGNVVSVHLRSGTVVRRAENRIMATPDKWVVPHIGPLAWPAVFAVDDHHLWIWSEGEWGWLDRSEAEFVGIDRNTRPSE